MKNSGVLRFHVKNMPMLSKHRATVKDSVSVLTLEVTDSISASPCRASVSIDARPGVRMRK